MRAPRRGGVILTTRRLVLRPFAASHVAAYAAIRAKPEVVSMLPGGPAEARAIADAERLVSARAGAGPGAAPWTVEAREGGRRLLGHPGLRPLPGPGGEIDPHTPDSAVRGRGLATEGCAAAPRAAFGPLARGRPGWKCPGREAPAQRNLNSCRLGHGQGDEGPGLRRVITLARPENTASLAVMRKLGRPREAEVPVFGVRAVRCAAHAPPPGRPEGAGACSTC